MRRVTSNYGFPVSGCAAGWLDAYRERWDYLTEASDAGNRGEVGA